MYQKRYEGLSREEIAAREKRHMREIKNLFKQNNWEWPADTSARVRNYKPNRKASERVSKHDSFLNSAFNNLKVQLRALAAEENERARERAQNIARNERWYGIER